MKFNPGHKTRTPPIHHPRMFRHPCKFDDADPEAVDSRAGA